MSAPESPRVIAILGVLRAAAEAGRGSLTPSDVELLEGVSKSHAELLGALNDALAIIQDCPKCQTRSLGCRIEDAILGAEKL